MSARLSNLAKLLAVAAALAVVFGCSGPPRPDLERLYARQANPDGQPPVVLVHGLLGGRLAERAGGREVWPGSVARLMLSDYADLSLPIDPGTLTPADSGLEVTGLTDHAAGRDFYGAILDVLENAGGYRKAEPGQPAGPGDKHVYVFAYDWRQDNVLTAAKFASFLAAIRDDYGSPDQQVDVIAHSMGGMLVRYYLRYGTADVLDDNDFPVTQAGAAGIRRVILLGTPSLGSVSAVIGLEAYRDLILSETDVKGKGSAFETFTPQERQNPKLLNASRRQRIANGSGRTVTDVNQLMERFEQAQKMMKQMRSGGGIPGMPGMPPIPGAAGPGASGSRKAKGKGKGGKSNRGAKGRSGNPAKRAQQQAARGSQASEAEGVELPDEFKNLLG